MKKDSVQAIRMMNPLMPKGVEHYHAWKVASGDSLAMNPLMPKGVEHIMHPTKPGVAIASDEPSDAERR